MPQEYLTPAELAATLRMSRSTIYRLIAGGQIPGTIRVSARMYRIPAAGVSQFITARGITQAQPPDPPGV